jgi:hypothetical protein
MSTSISLERVANGYILTNTGDTETQYVYTTLESALQAITRMMLRKWDIAVQIISAPTDQETTKGGLP